MRNYENYTIEDFVQDPYFRRWTLGELPPDDHFWVNWQKMHPGSYDKVEKAKSLVIALQVDHISAEGGEIRDAIDHILVKTAERPMSGFYRIAWPVAASVLILFALGHQFWQESVPEKHPAVHKSVTVADSKLVNENELSRTIKLDDGSEVTLEKHSSLRIGENFGKRKREVYLTGEAFFQISKNAEKPFLVYTGKVVTKVLGTSFRIKAYDTDANVSIGVRTGKVTVFKQEPFSETNPMLSEEVVLTPNQQAVFVKKDDHFVKTLVDNPVEIGRAHLKQSLDFTETSIPVVLGRLEEIYGVRMIFDAERLKDCNLTGTLNEGTLYDKLAIVCETIQTSYKVMDGQVVIYGKGCK